jgi:hypothetical protein
VLAEMKLVSMATTKKDMIAYVEAWQNELLTATYVIGL